MNKKLIFVLFIFSIFLVSCGKTEVTQVPNPDQLNSPEIQEEIVAEIPVVLDTETVEPISAVYAEYTAETLAGATDDIVLFFNAAWCPSCNALDAVLESEDIPENLTVLSVDYDSNFELRKKYGVVAQHTFVQVDNQGNLIKKWIGGNSVADIQGELGKIEVTEVTDTQ